jgi:RluA family pseudouridine synthase
VNGPGIICFRGGPEIQILHEDRSVLAIDKPVGWMLAPDSWTQTGRNLQQALTASIRAGDFWARSRRLRYLRFVHRLDAETTGVLLLAKSAGAVPIYSALFRDRAVEKFYLAVVAGHPQREEWVCLLSLAPDPNQRGKMKVGGRSGLKAETRFRVLERGASSSVLLAQPITGRTHQIRVHLAAAGHPVVGDAVYSSRTGGEPEPAGPLGLRAVGLAYRDPFQHRLVRIRAPADAFLRSFGFEAVDWTSPAAQ